MSQSLRIKRVKALFEAISGNFVCLSAVQNLIVELVDGKDPPLHLDIIPVSGGCLSGWEDTPASFAVPQDIAEAFVVRAAYANHYVTVHSAVKFDTAYAAALHLSLETGLIYQGVFNVQSPDAAEPVRSA